MNQLAQCDPPRELSQITETAPALLAGKNALFVDLNNSARFPTLTIGYLVAALRAAGAKVKVLSPLAVGVPGHQRDLADSIWTHLQRRLFFSGHWAIHPIHNRLHIAWREWNNKPSPAVLAAIESALSTQRFDVILISAYLDFYPSVVEIGKRAQAAGLPLIVGGPAFNLPDVAEQWLDIPGLSALIAAEVDHELPGIVSALISGEDVSNTPGIILPSRVRGPDAPPLRDLSRLPIPDFSDFPWHLYPHPIIPVMTGRGCSWARCSFCSDVSTVNGRTFRSRPVQAVLDELSIQGERCRAKDVFFVDIKLNSNLAMWHGILDGYQARLPGGGWVGMLHVATKGDNGLSTEELRAARAAGMVRATFGLESGSQHLIDRMGKGTSVVEMARVLHDAHRFGISMRATLMLGYPGETETELRETARFLRENFEVLHRVRVSRFAAIPGTRFARLYERSPEQFPGIKNIRWDGRFARGHYDYTTARLRGYRGAKADVLNLIYAINRRPLPQEASAFNGLL